MTRLLSVALVLLLVGGCDKLADKVRREPQKGRLDYEREYLRGIGGVNVTIEKLNEGALEVGLTEEQLQTDVELRLRQSGIRVLTEKERLTAPGGPFLYVNVNGHKAESGLHAFGISVALYQRVILERNGMKGGHVETWQRAAIGTRGHADGDSDAAFVRENVKDKVDEFLNAYLAANPK